MLGSITDEDSEADELMEEQAEESYAYTASNAKQVDKATKRATWEKPKPVLNKLMSSDNSQLQKKAEFRPSLTIYNKT